MKFEAKLTDDCVEVLDETGDTFFYVEPNRTMELIRALLGKDRLRVVEMSLRDHRGMLDECLTDPALTKEEREGFEQELLMVEQMLHS